MTTIHFAWLLVGALAGGGIAIAIGIFALSIPQRRNWSGGYAGATEDPASDFTLDRADLPAIRTRNLHLVAR